jgi:hypothetical protein
MAHHLRTGHRLVLRVTTSDPDKVPLFAQDVQVTVFTGPDATALDLPVVPDATLYPDTAPLSTDTTPTGPAQAPVEGSVTTAAPGGGQRVVDVTSQFVPFEVPANADDAKAIIDATPTLPADLDLYLERQAADGTWADVASGAGSDLDHETMTTTRLKPGKYRIEVHNYAGAPGNAVAVKATFYNSAGKAGS